MAEAAAVIVAANGLSRKVTVVSKPSFSRAVGVDLPRPAELLVS